MESAAEDGESNAILMLNKSAEDGDVDALYSIIANYPDILKRIDETEVVDTPLHIAARAGKAHYALEIASLKPSMAWKLNHLGLSPLHLAMENEHDQIVKGLVESDRELVRVRAKGKLTPLHYAAQTDNIDYLAGFLYFCPSAIEDRTVRLETAVHIALKNNNTRAFEVLFGWLRRVDKEIYILKFKDENGDTALHIATSTNQPEVMKRFIRFVDVNSKNKSNLTAMDIYHLHRHLLHREVGDILSGAKAKRASELPGSSNLKHADLLRRPLSGLDLRNKVLGIIIGPDRNVPPDELRNIMLVVAILIATATYQATLSPPGGFWQDDSNVKGQSQHHAGQMIMNPFYQFIFFALNTAAFYTSVATIFFFIKGIPGFGALCPSIYLLMFSYFSSLFITSPLQDKGVVKIVFFITVSMIIALLILGTMFLFSGSVSIFHLLELGLWENWLDVKSRVKVWLGF